MVKSVSQCSYEAGGVDLLPADQTGDVVSVVADSLHAAHEVLSAARTQLRRNRKSSKADLRKNDVASTLNNDIYEDTVL